MTSGEPFLRRVQLLHDTWVERRQVKALASSHEFDDQYRLLLTLRGWAEQAVQDIQTVYGGSLHIALSPPPSRDARDLAFSVTIGASSTITFSLIERLRMGMSRWFIRVSTSSTGPAGGVVAAGPERRNGQWTRGRLEDLLLSALGTFERSVSGDLSSSEPTLPATGS
jgi:hypothetical protein